MHAACMTLFGRCGVCRGCQPPTRVSFYRGPRRGPLRRPEGIRALSYFQSDENIALVKPLLNDAHFFFHSTDGRTGERYYAARHAAYQTFKAWGPAVEPPVYREDVR